MQTISSKYREAFVDEDYDLIICTGYVMADAVRDAAEAESRYRSLQLLMMLLMHRSGIM